MISVCNFDSPPKAAPARSSTMQIKAVFPIIVPSPKVSFQTSLSLLSVVEIIEQRYAVGLGPDADFTGVLKSFIIPLDGLLAIESDDEMAAKEIYAQGVPLI